MDHKQDKLANKANTTMHANVGAKLSNQTNAPQPTSANTTQPQRHWLLVLHIQLTTGAVLRNIGKSFEGWKHGKSYSIGSYWSKCLYRLETDASPDASLAAVHRQPPI